MEFKYNLPVMARLVVKTPGAPGHEREDDAKVSHVVAWMKGHDPEVSDAVREAMGWAEKLPPSFTCSSCGVTIVPGGKVSQMSREEKVKYAKMVLTKDPELGEMFRKAMGWRQIPQRDDIREFLDTFEDCPDWARLVIETYLEKHPDMAQDLRSAEAGRLGLTCAFPDCAYPAEVRRLVESGLVHDKGVGETYAEAMIRRLRAVESLLATQLRGLQSRDDTIRDLEAQLASAKRDGAHCDKVHCEFTDCNYYADVRKLVESGLVHDKGVGETYAEAMIRNLREEREQLDRLGKRRASGERGPLTELTDVDMWQKLMWLHGAMKELGLEPEPGATIIEQAEHHLRGLKAQCEALVNQVRNWKSDEHWFRRRSEELEEQLHNARLEVHRLTGLLKKEASEAVFSPPRAPEPENIETKMVVDLIWNCQQYIRALLDGRHPASELRALLNHLMGAMPIPRDKPNGWPTREWWSRAIQSLLDAVKKETPANG